MLQLHTKKSGMSRVVAVLRCRATQNCLILARLNSSTQRGWRGAPFGVSSRVKDVYGIVGMLGHHILPVHGSLEGGSPTFIVPVSVAVDCWSSTGPPFLSDEVST